MHLISNSDIICFIREWDRLKAQGRGFSELLDETVLNEVLNETPRLREQLRVTVVIDRHRGEFKGFSFTLLTLSQIVWTGHLSNLKIIDLSHEYNDTRGEVRVDGAIALSRALRSGKVPQLQTIDLWGNPIGNCGVMAIAHALEAGAVPKLRKLAIGPFRIEEDMFKEDHLAIPRHFEALVRALASGRTPALEHLALYRVVSGDDEVQMLMRGLRAGGLVGLRRLRLQGSEYVSRIGTKGMRAIAESPFFPSLIELNVSGNRIEDDAVTALIKAFKSSRMGYLEILDLDRNTMSDKLLVEFAKFLEVGHHVPRLQTLRLGPTRLTPTSARALVAAYQRNAALIVEITLIGWPSKTLRNNAEKYWHRNRRKSAASVWKEHVLRETSAMSGRKMKQISSQTDGEFPTSCFGRPMIRKWGRLRASALTAGDHHQAHAHVHAHAHANTHANAHAHAHVHVHGHGHARGHTVVAVQPRKGFAMHARDGKKSFLRRCAAVPTTDEIPRTRIVFYK